MFSINDGDAIIPGMLAEFTFNAWQGITFFDVSAIVDPNDHHGVKEIFPKNANTPMSGCQAFPCDNCYNVWNDDWATLSSLEADYVVLIGDLGEEKIRRMGGRVKRDVVEKRQELDLHGGDGEKREEGKMLRVSPHNFKL